MAIPKKCEQARLSWMAAYDSPGAASTPIPELCEHMTACEECRGFAAATKAAGQTLAGMALPAPDLDADRALLASLSAPRVNGPNWAGTVRRLLAAFRPLLVTGAASFAVTLAGGILLSQPPAEPVLDASQAGGATAGSPRESRAASALEARLARWLDEPTARLRPPPPPAAPAPSPDPHFRKQSESHPRIHSA